MEYAKICPICGRAFITSTKRIIYCGKLCAGDARRKRDRDAKKAKRAEASRIRNTHREEFARARTLEAEARADEVRKGFAKRISENDPAALMLREKAEHGNMTPSYWEYFAQSEIEQAEFSGTELRTIVNGISVYDDNFSEYVLNSIESTGHILIDTVRRART